MIIILTHRSENINDDDDGDFDDYDHDDHNGDDDHDHDYHDGNDYNLECGPQLYDTM